MPMVWLAQKHLKKSHATLAMLMKRFVSKTSRADKSQFSRHKSKSERGVIGDAAQ